ncbi:alpha/beta fold hydrolase [Sinisalibacter aestuarii]|uniref:Esterase n=1 Tax=Sinisalibacter aestuarii TaxID=2949426 RepID=A0ABQ5LSW3_9RHOB|nr:alpha/beta fold hydrolase [Sinisalibacter aestuarii]GKY88084.1 esterase [Sinisalibacter aestuarii]
MLATQSFGTDASRPPILIVHGLFGSGRNWGVIAKRLSETRRVVTADLRNHGDSPRAESQTYPEMAEDLAGVIGAIGGEADVIGHSMGGKSAMVLALTRPALVRRLLVADIAPVPYTHGDSHRGLIAAMRGLDLAAITTRGEADRALAADIPTEAIRAFLLQSLDVKAKRWKLNLEVLDRELDTVLSFPEIGGQFDGPALFLAGAESDYVRPEHRPRIKALFPNAKQAKLPGTGHWLHAEKPRDFEATARAFLGG